MHLLRTDDSDSFGLVLVPDKDGRWQLVIREPRAWALGSVGSDEYLRNLEREALTSKESLICEKCIQAIGKIGSRVATSALKSIYIEMEKRNEPELAWQVLQTLATIPNNTSLNFCIQKFKTKLEDIGKENQNQLLSILDNKPQNQLYQLLNRIHTLSHQLNTIVSPESLGLSDVLKE
jgi:hypothetical protein